MSHSLANQEANPPAKVRRCACGGMIGPGGECEGCRKKRLSRRPAEGAVAAQQTAPAVVHEVLRAPGRPLDSATRGSMEAKFGHDFSQVRVHADARAAESAREVGAAAYTVGNDIVINATRHSPSKALLAHELAHVVQQGGATPEQDLKIGSDHDAEEHEARLAETSATPRIGPDGSPVLRRSIFPGEGGPIRSRGGTLPYREATDLSHCIDIMGEANAAYCRQEVLHEPAPPLPLPQPCSPDQDPGWADFTGTPPAGSARSAWTQIDVVDASGTSGRAVRAVFVPGRSWVKPQFGNPTDRTATNCGQQVTTCEQSFPAGSTGGSYSMDSRPSVRCPAAMRPPAGTTATSFDQCESLIGTTCDQVAVAESNRLLHHEQGHFRIACVLANKGNIALRADSSLTVRNMRLTVDRKIGQAFRQYDRDTDHGCIQGAQNTWDADIAAQLPRITVP